jgi:cytidylate kinase
VRTIALSRQRGSGGSYIGQCVAERLGLRYIDRDLLRDAAAYLHEQNPGAGPDTASDNVRTALSSWWPRLAKAFSSGCADGIYIPPSSSVVYEGELFELETRLIREIAGDHLAVIVGRGAAQTLRGHSGVFSVLVHAPESWRVDRLQHLYGLDRNAAVQMVQHSDRDRAGFIRKLAGTDWTDARGYDLAVDTAALGLDAAVDLVVRVVADRVAGRGATAS